MTINEYQQRAMASLNPELKGRDVLINSVMGLCGESGEAIDIVKKWLAQGHPLDREHLAKELGDVAWIWPRRPRRWTLIWRTSSGPTWRSWSAGIQTAFPRKSPWVGIRTICKKSGSGGFRFSSSRGLDTGIFCDTLRRCAFFA